MPATLCIHAFLFLVPVQVGEWEVETPVPGWLGHQEHVFPHHYRENAFPYKHALVNPLFFSFVGLWLFQSYIFPHSKTLKVFRVFQVLPKFIPSKPDIAIWGQQAVHSPGFSPGIHSIHPGE